MVLSMVVFSRFKDPSGSGVKRDIVHDIIATVDRSLGHGLQTSTPLTNTIERGKSIGLKILGLSSDYKHKSDNLFAMLWFYFFFAII